MHNVSSFGAILNPDQVQAYQANSNEAYRRPCSILSSHWVALKLQLQVGNILVHLLTSIAPSAVLVVGNGTSTYLSELLFPSVAKAVLKLKRVPIAIVGADSVRHCGAGEARRRGGALGGRLRAAGGQSCEGDRSRRHCSIQAGDACTHACPWPLWTPRACASAALGSARARLNPGKRLQAAGDSVHQLQQVWSQTRHIRAGWVEKGNAYVVAQFSTRECTISLWNREAEMLPLRAGASSRWHTLLPWCCQVHCTGLSTHGC